MFLFKNGRRHIVNKLDVSDILLSFGNPRKNISDFLLNNKESGNCILRESSKDGIIDVFFRDLDQVNSVQMGFYRGFWLVLDSAVGEIRDMIYDQIQQDCDKSKYLKLCKMSYLDENRPDSKSLLNAVKGNLKFIMGLDVKFVRVDEKKFDLATDSYFAKAKILPGVSAEIPVASKLQESKVNINQSTMF